MHWRGLWASLFLFPALTTLGKSAASHFQSGLSIGFLRTGEMTWAQPVPPKFDNKMSTLKGHRHTWGMFATHSELILGEEERQTSPADAGAVSSGAFSIFPLRQHWLLISSTWQSRKMSLDLFQVLKKICPLINVVIAALPTPSKKPRLAVNRDHCRIKKKKSRDKQSMWSPAPIGTSVSQVLLLLREHLRRPHSRKSVRCATHSRVACIDKTRTMPVSMDMFTWKGEVFSGSHSADKELQATKGC